MSRSPLTAQRDGSGFPAALFVAACIWVVFALLAGRIAGALAGPGWYDLARQAVAALMLLGGFYLLARAGVADLRPLSSLGFVRRPTAGREFGLGLALGWGVAVALVVPALLSGNLSLVFNFDAASLLRFLNGTLVLCLFGLSVQAVLSGLPFRLLVRSVGPGWSTIAAIFVGISLAVQAGPSVDRSIFLAALMTGLFCAGFLRTRAIWLSLGLQIGWTFALHMLFGTSSLFTPPVSGVAQAVLGGPAWLTGGPFSPEASVFALVVLVAALIVLYRLTRDYAWHYTYQPLTGAGYPMDVPPPAQHLKEEQRVAAAAPLVQIAGISPALAEAPPYTAVHERDAGPEPPHRPDGPV